MSLASCGDDNNVMSSPDDNVADVQGVDKKLSKSGLVARGFSTLPTDEEEGGVNEVFTDDDILWFDVNTREIRFRDMDVSVKERCKMLTGIEFRLGDKTLFDGSTVVSLICSQIFDDLVLCCGNINNSGDVDMDSYYLLDCYPPQFVNDERVVANREKRAKEWQVFVEYLDAKGKLRK
jgi:hypothetical protein